MKGSYQQLTQSRFFVPDFNSAIFDGPVRIYFSQIQESLALKIYFHIQNEFSSQLKRLKDNQHRANANIFIMIYPKALQLSTSEDKYWIEPWEHDVVIGLNDLSAGIDFEKLGILIKKAFDQWENHLPLVTQNENFL